MGYYQQVADDYMADNPNVTIEIEAMAHEERHLDRHRRTAVRVRP